MSVLAARFAEDSTPIVLLSGDLDDVVLVEALREPFVAWDIETSGLDWRVEAIGSVQLQIGGTVYVVRPGKDVPHRMVALLEDPSVRKVFHHAMFDLRFMAHHWAAKAANAACTKIASKLLDPEKDCREHSLAAILPRYLGVQLDKALRRSDWTAAALSREQMIYAANDVLYLSPLYDRLDQELRRKGLADLRERCYAHLPTRVELDLGGFPDVFAY